MSKVTGLKSLNKSLKGLKHINISFLLKKLDLIPLMQRNIKDQGYFGSKWKGWASSSIGKRRKNGSLISPSSPLLYDTGKLYNSFKELIKKDSFSLINTMPYAGYQNAMRPFLGIPKNVKKDIQKEVFKEIDKIWNKI